MRAPRSRSARQRRKIRVALAFVTSLAASSVVAPATAAPRCADPARVSTQNGWTKYQLDSYPAEDRGLWPPGSGPYSDKTTTYAVGNAPQPSLLVTNGRRVRLSTDGACSWRDVYVIPEQPSVDKPVFGLDAVNFVAVAEGPGVSRHLYVGFASTLAPAPRLWMTKNDGATWSSVQFDAPPSGYLAFLLVAPQDPRILYAYYVDPLLGRHFYRSIDRGLTWRKMTAPEVTPCGASCGGSLRIDPTSPNLLWAWDLYRVAHSRDGGLSWTDVRTRTTSNDTVAMRFSIYRRKGQAARLIVVPRVVKYAPDLELFRSDGGVFWRRLVVPIKSEYLNIQLDFVGQSELVVRGRRVLRTHLLVAHWNYDNGVPPEYTLLRSDDNVHWTREASPPLAVLNNQPYAHQMLQLDRSPWTIWGLQPNANFLASFVPAG